MLSVIDWCKFIQFSVHTVQWQQRLVVGEGGEHCLAGLCDVFGLEEGCTLGADRSVCCVVLLSNRAAAAQQPTV